MKIGKIQKKQNERWMNERDNSVQKSFFKNKRKKTHDFISFERNDFVSFFTERTNFGNNFGKQSFFTK